MEPLQDVEFNADGVTLRGWLYLPVSLDLPAPIVVMAAGFACVKEMHLDRYAEVFAAAGLAALVFDFRNLGASGGEPRQELDPWRQIEDYRHAITYASTLPEVDAGRIGIWGSSYSGGHALAVAATDRRVRCVAVQVPTISGHGSGLRRVPMSEVEQLTGAFAQDRLRRMKGEAPAMRSIVGDAGENPIYPAAEVREWFLESAKNAPAWRNKVTLRSMEFARAYEPGIYVPHISPTPLLMIVALKDFTSCTDLQLAAYERALEPKKLVTLAGGHFAPYGAEFDRASGAAKDWFLQHLT
jgi:dienelactone hydrolase